MIISKRLEAIASLINDNVHVIDIGCDHAYLDIYLALNRDNVTCYACDINKNALSFAKKNIIKYNLTNKIDTFLCDGLNGLKIKNNSVIVISGMGTSTIKHILSNNKSKLASEIIIQSNNNLEELRTFMIKNNYFIDNEKVVFDKGKFYVIICFKKGKKIYKKYMLRFGPTLINDASNNRDYFLDLLKKKKNKYNNIPFKYFRLRFQTLIDIKRIKKIMCKAK